MSKQLFKKCLGVDIGTSSVKIAECSFERNSVRIGALLKADLPAFPDAEAAELGTAKVIKDLLKANKISTREAVFCLGGQQIFSRRVRLPDSSDERLARIVNYEARQQIPFPPEKTRIEYQIFRFPGEDEVEVLMVAARRDHIENFMRLVDRTGLKAINLSVSSVALFNYLAFQLTPIEEFVPKKKSKKSFLPKKGKKGAEGGAEAPEKEMEFEEGASQEEYVVEEAKALLNIGESHTDLVIARKARSMTLAFTRSIPIAGREFSRFIQNSVGMETFAEADRLKREACRVFPPEQVPEDDPSIDPAASAALSEIIDTRLARQIQLSLDFFIAQPDGMAVDEIIVSGGSTIIEGLPETLEERLGVPVRRLEEPVSQSLLLNTTAPSSMVDYGIAVGEAITGLGLGRVTTNFLPERFKTSLKFPRVQVAAMAILLGFMVFLSRGMGDRSITSRERAADALEVKAASLQPQQEEITQAEEERIKLANMIDAFLRALDVQRRGRLLSFYADLVAAIRGVSAATILESIEITPFGDVVFVGKTTDPQAAPVIREVMLDKLSPYLDPQNPPRLERMDRDQNQVITFEIQAKLRRKFSRISTPTPETGAGAAGGPGGTGPTLRPSAGGNTP